MKFVLRPALMALLIAVFSVSAVLAQSAPANLLDACVDSFDPDADYFPEKVMFEDSDFITVEYFNHYKVVTVENAYDDAPAFVYVLVQCGTPAPSEDAVPEGAQVVNVPVSRFVALSTTQLPHLIALGQLDSLVGVDSFLYISSPEVQELIAADALVELGFGSSINLELALEIEPDLVMAYGFNPEFDAHPVLNSAGITTVLNAEWRESSPLGRAEWLKYTALFFNAEDAANTAYDAISTEYRALSELVSNTLQDERPVVLWNTFNFGAWQIPGANTYAAQLTADAGGVLALGELAPDFSLPASFETVYEGGLSADVWLLNAFAVFSLDDLLTEDERYADFDALQAGAVWNNDLDVNENGGSNYYELGVTNPQLILADLVAILYPDALPDHTFNFWRSLE